MKLIKVFLILSLFISCSSTYKSSFEEVELNSGIKKLLDVYLDSNNKLSVKNYVLYFQVVQDDDDDFFLVVDNGLKKMDGFHTPTTVTFLTFYKKYKIYVHDEENLYSVKTGDVLKVKYNFHSDSILPSTYSGNPWEVHFKNGNISKIHFYASKDTLAIKKRINEIRFNSNL